MTKKVKNLLIWKFLTTMTKKDAYISNELRLQSRSFTFIHKNPSLHSTTSILSFTHGLQVYASLDKPSCTNQVNFGNCQDRFGQFSWSKIDSNYMDVKLKVFKKDDNKDFRPIQNVTMGEADFKHFMRLRNQLVTAEENFAREGNLSPVVIS